VYVVNHTIRDAFSDRNFMCSLSLTCQVLLVFQLTLELDIIPYRLDRRESVTWRRGRS
jgi:hypothetical protein